MSVVSLPARIVVSHPLFTVGVLVVAAIFQPVGPVPFVLRDLSDDNFPDPAVVVYKTVSEEEPCHHMVLYTIRRKYAINAVKPRPRAR